MSTDKDIIIVEIEFKDLARDKMDLSDMDDMMCRKLEEAGIPVAYVENFAGKRIFRGVLHGSLHAKNCRVTKNRIVTWRRDLLRTQ
jgi:hypothetical protein